MRYVHLYNTQLPQAALHARSPLQAMKDWHKLKPALFKKRPYQLTGCDTYAHFRDVPESAWRWPSFSEADLKLIW